MSTQRKAVALISGGLDSLLATRVILDQGIHVEGLNFYTGFCVEGHTHAIRQKDRAKPKRNNALWAAEQLGIKLHIIDVIEEYKSVVINPKHGFGSLVNPCLDCKGFMVRKAKEWMEENGFDFIITGEVMGQRPMSQRRETFPIIARESGAGDRLLRPLSARFFAPSLPEREGWVNREQLLKLHGRSRKPQIAMAQEFGYEEYAQPAGGCCFLTDVQYAAKLQDMWQTRGTREYELDDIMLLKVGRHLRPRPHFKMVIGREEGENKYMEGYRRQFTCIRPVGNEGPLTLLDGNDISADDIQLAAQLAARFGDGKNEANVTLEVTEKSGTNYTITVAPMSRDMIPKEWYI